MKKILTILIILVIIFSFLYFNFQKRLYKTITQEVLIGIIRCAKSIDKNYDFYLFYFPVINGKQSDFKFYKMKGAEWIFEGEIIKWKRPLNAIGFKTAHRPIRICDSKGTSYPIEENPSKIVFKFVRILPGVDTSFISAVRQSFIPKYKFEIYATNSGYLIRKIR